MARHCVCGKVITKDHSLCNDCLGKYGADPDKWEDWVKFLVSDEQKEVDRARNHKEEMLGEAPASISGEAEHNLSRAKRFPDMDFEDFVWMNQ